jgi:hypothetical protein
MPLTDYVLTAIDKGSRQLGSETALAAHLTMAKQTLHQVKKRKRALTLEQAAALGVLTGYDGSRLFAESELRRIEDAARQETLRAKLFTLGAAGLVLLLSYLGSAEQRPRELSHLTAELTVYTLCSLVVVLRAARF